MLKVKKIKPLFNRIVVTARKYEDNIMIGSIIDSGKSNTIKEYQEVVAVGTTVRDIKVGDTVLINPTRYQVRKHREGSLKDGVISDNPVTHYNFNMVEVNGETCILLFDSDVDYVIEDFEELEDSTSSLITPSKPNIIV